jgi:hypothetical protein
MVNRLSYFNQFTSGTGGGGGGGAAISTGTYVGDGTDNRVITSGLSVPPKQIMISRSTAFVGPQESAFKTDIMAGKLGIALSNGSSFTGVAILGNNFTVDGSIGTIVNFGGETYFFSAIG